MKEQSKQETPRERFRRLASLRTNTILKRLKVLGNCSNRHAYEYYEDDIEKIFSEIEKEVKLSWKKLSAISVENEPISNLVMESFVVVIIGIDVLSERG